VQNSYICRRCGRELKELLVGDGTREPVVEERHSKAQPGIVWYIHRLRESAYRQAKMAQALGGHHGSHGYYLLGDHEAIKLLARISATLAIWDDRCEAVVGPQKHVNLLVTRGTPERLSGHVLAALRARALAEHIPELRHNCPDIGSLYNDMLGYAKAAWKVINRPDDICCGPCPNLITDKDEGEKLCETMLYAEEFAETVRCPKCRTEHPVSDLRDELKRQVSDMLFTGPELLKLMETRLNDRVPKSNFYRMIQEGRLLSRTTRLEDGERVPLYTYDDVCEAREKTPPRGRPRKKSA
jgi:DNA-directed RNA polymerase subunit RPC12/RpoP